MNLSKQFTRREKLLLCVFAALCLAALYLFAVHYPVTAALAQAESDRADAELQLQVLQAQEARMEAMEAELEEILSQPGAPQTPRYDNLPQLAVFLDGVMARAESYAMDFQPVEEAEEGNIVRRRVEMELRCRDMATAREIVAALEESRDRCLVESMTVERAEETGSITDGAVEVGLRVTFFERMK